MAVWLIRAGKHGDHELKFIQESRVYVTWDRLDVDLSKLSDRSGFINILATRYPDAKPKKIVNWASQLWPFAHEMKKGDLVVLPLKTQRAVQVGEVAGDYRFEPNGPKPFFHWRSVRWIGEAVPREHFGQDLLNSFGAFLTICRVQRNNAEARLGMMRNNGWKSETMTAVTAPSISVATGDADGGEETDLSEAASDQIAQLISARFKGTR